MTFTRRNAWNNDGTFSNLDLLWYAKAVGVMKSKPISDPTSWWFYAAIHGQYLTDTDGVPPYLQWRNIKSIPASAQLNTLPPATQIETFWDQCTHGTWFFLPWHRGYLTALEHILRAIVVDLGGPSDWTLPYWNYLKANQNVIPPAFQQATLPDKTPNPLYIQERYNNGTQQLNDNCQGNTSFSVYGGNDDDSGAIESNPHNAAHLKIGGRNAKEERGLMSSVPAAALDPIFYLHHANIDRMWAAWNKAGNTNPTTSDWLDAVNAPKAFAMPMDSKGTAWNYTSQDVTTTNVNYYGGVLYQFTYDDLSLYANAMLAAVAPQDILAQRLEKINPSASAVSKIQVPMNLNSELVGANSDALELVDGKAKAKVKIDQGAWGKVSKSLESASATNLPDEVYLRLEGIKGTETANSVSVYVNQKLIDTIHLFGLQSSSLPNKHHGGAGLTFKVNITDLIDNLHLEGNVDVESLEVSLEATEPLSEGGKITVDRIGVYRVHQ